MHKNFDSSLKQGNQQFKLKIFASLWAVSLNLDMINT